RLVADGATSLHRLIRRVPEGEAVARVLLRATVEPDRDRQPDAAEQVTAQDVAGPMLPDVHPRNANANDRGCAHDQQQCAPPGRPKQRVGQKAEKAAHRRQIGDVAARKAAVPDLTNHLDRKSTRLNSSHVSISYAVFCLKKKTKTNKRSRADKRTDQFSRLPFARGEWRGRKTRDHFNIPSHRSVLRIHFSRHTRVSLMNP